MSINHTLVKRSNYFWSNIKSESISNQCWILYNEDNARAMKCIYTSYFSICAKFLDFGENSRDRSGTVNSKSFVGKVFLRIKWKFELAKTLN